MKAFILTKIGSIRDLEFTDFYFKPKKGQVKVKVLYCGVNHLDLLIIEGKRKTCDEFPLILGSEIVGQRSDTGKLVAVYPWTFCGACNQCKSGNENICDYGGTFGRNRDGGYAEFIAVPPENLVEIPDSLDPNSIAASTLSAITALHMIKRAKIPNGATVLVNGATGGVGTATIQILKSKKCKIIARTSHKNKIAPLKKIGADEVLVNMLPEIVTFIVDAMGGKVWSESVEILSKNGTIVFCATTLPEPGVIDIGKAMSKQLNILGSYGGTREDLKEVIELIKKGVITPAIDQVFPLEELPLAFKKLKDKKVFGKILIKVR